jgi:hypothetical protein
MKEQDVDTAPDVREEQPGSPLAGGRGCAGHAGTEGGGRRRCSCESEQAAPGEIHTFICQEHLLCRGSNPFRGRD